jgi:hypothetical protein
MQAERESSQVAFRPSMLKGYFHNEHLRMDNKYLALTMPPLSSYPIYSLWMKQRKPPGENRFKHRKAKYRAATPNNTWLHM